MPHRDFDAMRREFDVERDPITFTFMERQWTISPNPTLGDTFELGDAPQVVLEKIKDEELLAVVQVLVDFIGRMMSTAEQKQAWTALTYEIPATYGQIIIDIAGYITAEVTGVPFELREDSSSGQESTGQSSNTRMTSGNRSQRRAAGRGTRSSTTSSRTASPKKRS